MKGSAVKVVKFADAETYEPHAGWRRTSLPGDRSHVVRNPLDSTSVGLDIFVPGRSFDFWTKRGNGQSKSS